MRVSGFQGFRVYVGYEVLRVSGFQGLCGIGGFEGFRVSGFKGLGGLCLGSNVEGLGFRFVFSGWGLRVEGTCLFELYCTMLL